MRRNRDLAVAFGANFGAFLEHAVVQTSSMARSHFRACHIEVENCNSEVSDGYNSTDDWE